MRVVYNFGREDAANREALQRLATSADGLERKVFDSLVTLLNLEVDVLFFDTTSILCRAKTRSRGLTAALCSLGCSPVLADQADGDPSALDWAVISTARPGLCCWGLWYSAWWGQ